MSCRVLGRRVEEAVMRELLDLAKRRSVARLHGLYIPTDRNKLVEQHYGKLGFRLVDTRDDGATEWELEVATAKIEIPPMIVRSSGFEPVSELRGS